MEQQDDYQGLNYGYNWVLDDDDNKRGGIPHLIHMITSLYKIDKNGPNK